MSYSFEIIEKDWYKRRAPSAELRPVSVTIPDYKQEHNHMCTMEVTFEDGSRQALIARVIFNKISEQWTVDAMKVAVKVITRV